jgi:putative NADH-flavin reductase
MSMKIALIGATGNVGQRLTKEATSRGHEVTAISRNPDPAKTPGAKGVALDLHDDNSLAEAIKGHDAAILSVRHQNTDITRVVWALRKAGLKRIAIVGGAASLMNDKNIRLIDTPGFPEAIAVEARPAANALDWLRKNADDLDWAFVSPSMMLGPGERTGKFRKGKHHLLVAEDGKSSISYEDLSVAVLDELETPSVHADRFTVGY